jgi:hypothetical protein
MQCTQVSRLANDVNQSKNSLSMSTLRPTVSFHSRPALAILCNSLSLSFEGDMRELRGPVLEFAASSMDGEGPEKNAWILYISLYDCDSGM